MGVFSWLVRLSALFFTGFRIFLVHIPVIPAIVAVSPKPARFSFSCQGDALTGFIMLYMRLLPSFPVSKHIRCGQQFLWPMVLTVYLAYVHVFLNIRVSYFVQVLYQSGFQELFLCVFTWYEVVYKSYFLSNWAVIMGDYTCGILEVLK